MMNVCEKPFGIRSIVAALPLALSAAGAFAGVFGTLPDPVVEEGKNVYTLGASTSTAAPTYDQATDYDYIDWAALNVPAGSVVKLNGALVLDDLPTGLDYNWENCTRLALVNEALVAEGQTVVIPTNVLQFLYYKSTVTKSEDGTSFTLSSPAGSDIRGDLELNGGMELWGRYAPSFYGALTGSGVFTLHKFGVGLAIYGMCDFRGTVYFTNSQAKENLRVYSPAATSRVGTVRTHHYGGPGQYGAQYVLFDPQRDVASEPSVLVVSNLLADCKQSNSDGLSSKPGSVRRWGAQLCVYSNNTIRVDKVTGSTCPIGLFAEQDWAYRVGNPPSFDKGLGNVILGDQGNRANYYYVSPMMNVTLTGNHGAYATTTLTFDYRAESNVVNRAEILDLSKIRSYPNPDMVQVYGYSPANLPQRVTVRSRETTLTPLNLTDAEWTMPFDFGAADVNPARCETNCKLAIPATGTVYVTNATVAADAAYPAKWTEYPVLTTCAGGAPTNDAGASVFDDWEVKPVGEWGQVRVEKVVKDTGLYLRMRQVKGVLVIIR